MAWSGCGSRRFRQSCQERNLRRPIARTCARFQYQPRRFCPFKSTAGSRRMYFFLDNDTMVSSLLLYRMTSKTALQQKGHRLSKSFNQLHAQLDGRRQIEAKSRLSDLSNPADVFVFLDVHERSIDSGGFNLYP